MPEEIEQQELNSAEQIAQEAQEQTPEPNSEPTSDAISESDTTNDPNSDSINYNTEASNINSVNVSPVHFETLDPPDNSRSDTLKLSLLMDISVDVTIELGRTQMLIKDVLNLGMGSIVELDKLAGEPVDLLVNKKKFAEGEVVVIDENFGIRLTNLVNSEHSIEQAKSSLPKKV